jgi:hypothetical protein
VHVYEVTYKCCIGVFIYLKWRRRRRGRHVVVMVEGRENKTCEVAESQCKKMVMQESQ